MYLIKKDCDVIFRTIATPNLNIRIEKWERKHESDGDSSMILTDPKCFVGCYFDGKDYLCKQGYMKLIHVGANVYNYVPEEDVSEVIE